MSRNLHLYIVEIANGETLTQIDLTQTTSEQTAEMLAAPDVKKAYLKKYARDRAKLVKAQRIVDLADGKLALQWEGW